MSKIAKEVLFYAVSSAVIIPAPILWFAWMTNKTIWECLYR
jgi:hypothetical protein